MTSQPNGSWRPGRLQLATAAAPILAALLLWAEGLPEEIYQPALWIGIALGVAVLFRGARTPWLMNAALAWTAVAGSLALGDLALRVAGAGPQEAGLALLRWPKNDHLYRYPKNRDVDVELSGDIAGMTGIPEDARPRRMRFRTGPLGFRNAPPFPERALDLILLGDSFGMGGGTSEEHVWERLLRDELRYQTYNLSTPGGPWGMLLNLKAEIDRLPTRPGTIVLWALFTGNDLEDRYRDYYEFVPNGPLDQLSVRFRSFRRRSPVRRRFEGLAGPGYAIRRAPHDPSFLYLGEYAERSRLGVEAIEAHPNHPRLVRIFQEMARFAAERQLRVVVVSVPTKAEVYAWLLEPDDPATGQPSGFARVVGTLARAADFPFLDLKPALVKEAHLAWEEGEYVWWRDDTHWNPRGHAAAARAVREELLAPLARGG